MGKKTLSFTLFVALVLGCFAGSADCAKKAKLTQKNVSLVVGQKKQVKIKNKAKKAKYKFASSKKAVAAVNKKGVITAKKAGKAKVNVKEVIKKKTRKVGTVTVMVSANENNSKEPVVQPTVNPTATATETPSANATKEPEVTPEATPVGTPDPYTENVMSIYITEGEQHEVHGATCDVTMTFVDVEIDGDYFTGSTSANGASGKASSVVCKDYKEGDELYCYRYIVAGKDDTGADCKIYIEDNGIKNSDGTITTKPIIFTNSKSLAWLETADLQGRVTEEGGQKVIDIMWNESNKEPVVPDDVVRPDETKNYNKEIFTFKIDIGGAPDVTGNTGNASMINFGCSSDCANFKGKGVSTNFVDTRKQFLQPVRQVQTLSARYILEGTDKNGNPCKIYVENNGIDDNGMVTEPIIITDCPEYAWIESAPTHGTVSWGDKLTIHMWTTTEAYQE